MLSSDPLLLSVPFEQFAVCIAKASHGQAGGHAAKAVASTIAHENGLRAIGGRPGDLGLYVLETVGLSEVFGYGVDKVRERAVPVREAVEVDLFLGIAFLCGGVPGLHCGLRQRVNELSCKYDAEEPVENGLLRPSPRLGEQERRNADEEQESGEQEEERHGGIPVIGLPVDQ